MDRDFLAVQWLRLCAHNAGGLGLIPEQGARSHTLQLRLIKIFFNKWTEDLNTLQKDIKTANKHMENYHRCYRKSTPRGATPTAEIKMLSTARSTRTQGRNSRTVRRTVKWHDHPAELFASFL